jgi:hypothetical protein
MEMIKLTQLSKNVTELFINGTTILYSYETPVAAVADGQLLRTSQKFSNTTSRHINQWLNGMEATVVSQEEIEKLVA